MNKNLIAKTSITIHASKVKVWDALVNPKAIQQYMFGTNAVSDWIEGSPIIWKGEWQGKAYQDKGVILEFKPGQTLRYSHFSPLYGLLDKPENYHVVTIDLSEVGDQTHVVLAQDNNQTEKEREDSGKNWGVMLSALKKFLE